MIETAIGLDRLREIANANQVLRLALSNLDLQADLGMVCDAQETELRTARYQIVLASRLAQIAPPIDDWVTPSTDDLSRITDDAERAKHMGFGGKLCIHPNLSRWLLFKRYLCPQKMKSNGLSGSSRQIRALMVARLS